MGSFIFSASVMIQTSLVLGLAASASATELIGLFGEKLDPADFEPYDPNAEYTSQAGISHFETNNNGTTRRLRNVREMLRSLICYDYFKTNPTGDCPYRSNNYYRALRNYGCNCYPENSDSVNAFDPDDILWNLGNNGVPIDDVDMACRQAWGNFHCYYYDGCELGVTFTYFTNTEGEITCGPRDDPWYQSDPEGKFCEISACHIEKIFAESVYPMIGSPMLFRYLNKDNYGAWEHSSTRHEDQCAHAPGASHHKHECCGAWPNRNSFDHDEEECCADGTTEPIGFC